MKETRIDHYKLFVTLCLWASLYEGRKDDVTVPEKP